MGFPDVYEVGMSHLGFRLLHAQLAARSDLRVERVFLPWPDLQRRLEQTRAPLGTLESGMPLRQADLLGLSLQYELSQAAVLKLLDLAHIPRRAASRADGRWPIVLVGGSGALNPEPIAQFVDAFFVGEADEAIGEIVDALAGVRHAPRGVRLERLGRVEGIYVPEWYEVQDVPDRVTARLAPHAAAVTAVRRRYVPDLDSLRFPAVSIVPFCALVHDRVAVELQRGCSRGCRFCQAGFTTRPTRQRSAERVLQLAREQLRLTGYEDLSLLSLSAGDHPALPQLLATLFEEHAPARVAVSLPSLRTESLGPILEAYLSKVRKAGFTLAPEAGSQRLRQVINKGNSEDNLLDSVCSVVRAGFLHVKLYFMIGLPTETDHDVLAIAELATRALSQAQAINRGARLTVSVSTFIPKAHTSFQWEAAPDLTQIQHKHELLRSSMPRRVKLKWHDPGQSLVEAVLSRGDRRLAAVLERVVTPQHSGMDAWTDHFDLGRWERALAEAHQAGQIQPPERYLQARALDDPLPWDHIDVGVTRRYLAMDREDALAGRTRADCTDGSCDQCGVCPEAPLHRVADAACPSTPPRGQPDHASPLPVRLWYRKVGSARLLSHLELAAALERAARRAALPLAFSAGYHPKPKLRFSPALPLGAESVCEFVELELDGPLSVDAIAEKLATQLPFGLEVERVEEAPHSLLPLIGGVRWRFTLEPPPADLAALLGRARQRLQRGVLLERRNGKQRDLSAIVLDLAVVDAACFEARCAFAQDGAGTARPVELLGALLDLDDDATERTRIVRAGWIFDETRSQGDVP